MVVIQSTKKKEPIKEKIMKNVNNVALSVTLPPIKESNDIFDEDNPFEKLVSDSELASIQKDLSVNHGDLLNESFESTEAKKDLAEVIRKEYRFGDNPTGIKKAKYVVSETVGLSFIDRLLGDKKVNDIGYNGTFLSVESSSKIQFFSKDQIGLVDPEKQIFNLISKVANSMGKNFNRSFPILDSVSGNIRMNAIHKSSSTDGSTFSIRVLKAEMALTEENFLDLAPLFLIDFFEVLMKVGSSILVGGETGSGKTELLKWLCSKIPISDRMFVVEDVPEMRLKTLLPSHDIFSTVSTPTASLNDLLVATTRSYPKWVIPAETRDSTASDVIEVGTNGHSVMSSMHVKNCRSMAPRLQRMAKEDKSVIVDILQSFGIGVHIETSKIEIDPENMIFRKIRYISEIVEFSVDELTGLDTTTTLFKQEIIDNDFYVTTGQLSDDFKRKMSSNFLSYELPEMSSQKVEKSEELMSVLELAKQVS